MAVEYVDRYGRREMCQPSASFEYLAALISTVTESGDRDRLKATEAALRNAADLTESEREDLRSRIWGSSARLTALAGPAVPDLIEMCHTGEQDACLELDRRGVEPPLLEPGPPPVAVASA